MQRPRGTRGDAGALAEVRRRMAQAIERSPAGPSLVRLAPSVLGGKMLRARLILRVGRAAGVPPARLARAGAAVELMHAASLLHDDILDGGTRRRGEPAVWVSEGTRAAVLLGDLLVGVAAAEVRRTLPHLLPLLVDTLHDMCEAEAEQDLAGAGADGAPTWRRCVSIARRKTGSLFGFAAACAAGPSPARIEALHRAGRDLGTAYQLADDLLDECGDPRTADKSLGTDAASGKLTAARFFRSGAADPRAHIARLLRASDAVLGAWPPVQAAWCRYVREEMTPLVTRFAGTAARARA